jgi:putative Holliday junction resolvase
MRILALDPGERRIGMALADEQVRLARPLGVLERRSRAEDFARLAALAAEHQVARVVVGQPLAPDGGAGRRAASVARWAAALAAALGLPVELWNERYSSVEAAAIVRAQGAGARRRHTSLDAVAAAVILQDYLDAGPASGGESS